MKLIIDDKIPFIQGQAERVADEVVYLPGSKIEPDDVRDADALIVRTRTHCNRQLLEGSRVRFIATATIGFDHLDTDYLNEAGIVWTNCPGCNATSVAQYVRNALFEAEREGIVKLSEASLGIVGYGHVGRAVCESLRPYVREILLNDPPLLGGEGLRVKNEGFLLRQATQASPNVAERRMKDEGLRIKGEELRIKGEGLAIAFEEEKSGNPDTSLSTHHSTFKSLVDLASSCDIISFHTPLTAEGPYPTFHLANEQFFQSLKRKPLLINAARGGVVDEAALLDAMDKGLVRQAIIDTWEGEPVINRALLSKVFIGTPHIAGYSADGKANATLMALRALVRWQSSLGSIDIEPMFDIQPPLAQPERTGIFYSPTSDSNQLKESPQNFENLRGNYLLRRE